jgi:hypothetical protein
MNTSDFVRDLLASLAMLPPITQVDLQTEGPIVRGRALITAEIFLAFYYNQATQTQAFALIKDDQRIWGIDFDAWRGWHLHPVDAPTNHLPIESPSVPAIIEHMKCVLNALGIQ